MNIIYAPLALKQLTALPQHIQLRIIEKIEIYAKTPHALANQTKRLKGNERLLRLRVGDYRILFNEDGMVMNIIRIGHRREVYN